MSPLIIIHIEKSGGTSLRESLKRITPDIKQCYDLDTRGITADLNRGADIKIINGHYGFGIHKQLKIAPRYTTQLRSPIDRFVSHYNHWLNRPHFNDNYDVIQKQCKTLDDFLKHEQSDRLNNFMVRRIAGVPNGTEVTEQHLTTAMCNLTKYFEFVTFLDDPEGINKAYNKIGFPIQIGHENKGASLSISSYQFDNIRKRVSLDKILYLYAQKLFRGK